MMKTETVTLNMVKPKVYCKDCKWFERNRFSEEGGYCDFHKMEKSQRTGLKGRVEQKKANWNNDCESFEPIKRLKLLRRLFDL